MGGHNVKKSNQASIFSPAPSQHWGILLYFIKYIYFNQYKFGPIVKSLIDPIDT